jgi:hypothetical protein
LAPTVSDRLSGDDPDRAFLRLVKTAAAIGYTVEFAEFVDQRNGDCTFAERSIRIRQGLTPAQSVKTLAHELSHANLHGDDFTGTRDIAELEAESVAFIVCHNVGLDSSAYSFGYVASWIGGGSEAIKSITASGQRIVRAARQILDSESTSEEMAALITPSPLGA